MSNTQTSVLVPALESIYAAWHAIGADVAGLEWAKFVELLADTLAVAHGWHPIETAPRDGTSVLLFEKHENVPFVGYWYCNREWRADRTFYATDGNACVIDNVCQQYVTHWMPLPADPVSDVPTQDAP